MNLTNGIYEIAKYEYQMPFRLFVNKETDSYPSHWHTAAEIIMTVKGRYTVILTNKTYHMEEGDILVIPSGELHHLIAPPTGIRYILHFDFSYIHGLNCFSSILPCLYQEHYITSENAPDVYPKLKSLLIEVDQECSGNNLLREAVVYNRIIEFYILIGRKYANKDILFPNVKDSKQKEYILKFAMIFDYIKNHYNENLTLDSIADISGFSKFHFARLFKQYTNQTFCDYLNQVRVKQAETLLVSPALSVTDVALQVGFSSISTFNRVFKNFKNCTPSEYKAFYLQNRLGSFSEGD